MKAVRCAARAIDQFREVQAILKRGFVDTPKREVARAFPCPTLYDVPGEIKRGGGLLAHWRQHRSLCEALAMHTARTSFPRMAPCAKTQSCRWRVAGEMNLSESL